MLIYCITNVQIEGWNISCAVTYDVEWMVKKFSAYNESENYVYSVREHRSNWAEGNGAAMNNV